MNPIDLEVLRCAMTWQSQGRTVHLATVMHTWGSAPRQAGALMALSVGDQGDVRVMGSVSGGCVEDDLIERARTAALPATPQRVTYGVTRDEAARFGLPCGGTLSLLVEPVTSPKWLAQALDIVERHQLVARIVDLQSGQSRLVPATPKDGPEFDGKTFRSVYGPRWRLLIIGANQTGKMLADIARSLEFQVSVCDPREEFNAVWAGVQRLLLMPDDAVTALKPDARTAVVALTHDPKLDDMALLEALASDAFYVGALGSHTNQVKRRERLALFDLTPAQIGRLRGPVGLKIASRTPAEIAVAIAAELILVRNAQAAAPVMDDEADLPLPETICGVTRPS